MEVLQSDMILFTRRDCAQILNRVMMGPEFPRVLAEEKRLYHREPGYSRWFLIVYT